MWEYIIKRVITEGEYIVEKGATVRAAAEFFDVSKSTVHKDVTERLEEIDKDLFEEVKKVLSKNLSERHIRGGLATKSKYERIKKSNSTVARQNGPDDVE
ncbi:MAG TPA: sporulation transcriptional regulator SpoIIID [Candidatus Coproplasma excrementipullorum]|nr:sporulation transcriptional regulator SpoIIID [Candidatus Coproplasma excrementipullorum]